MEHSQVFSVSMFLWAVIVAFVLTVVIKAVWAIVKTLLYFWSGLEIAGDAIRVKMTTNPIKLLIIRHWVIPDISLYLAKQTGRDAEQIQKAILESIKEVK